MFDDTVEAPASQEERLQKIVFQFMNLYERLSEDRQALQQQSLALSEKLKVFDDSVKQFKTDLPALREQLTTSLQNTANTLLKTMGTEAGRGVVAAVQSIVDQLQDAAQKAKQQLLHDQDSFLRTHWLIIGTTIIAAALGALLIVKMALPRPMLPLSDHGVSLLNSGQILESAWPHMTQKERDRLIAFSFAPDKKK